MCCLCIQFTHENTSERTILHLVKKKHFWGGQTPPFQVWLLALQKRLATSLKKYTLFKSNQLTLCTIDILCQVLNTQIPVVDFDFITSVFLQLVMLWTLILLLPFFFNSWFRHQRIYNKDVLETIQVNQNNYTQINSLR